MPSKRSLDYSFIEKTRQTSRRALHWKPDGDSHEKDCAISRVRRLGVGSLARSPGSRGNNNCPISIFEGRITGVNRESGELSLMSSKTRTRKFRVNGQTSYRIPGVNERLL